MKYLLTTSLSYGIAEIFARLVQFGSTFYIASKCSKTEFGTFGFLIALQQVASLFGQAGFSEIITNKIANSKSIEIAEKEIGTIKYVARTVRIGWLIIFVIVLSAYVMISNKNSISIELIIFSILSGLLLSKLYVDGVTFQIFQNRRKAVMLKILPITFINLFGLISFILSDGNLLFFFIGAVSSMLFLSVFLYLIGFSEKSRVKSLLTEDKYKIFISVLPFLLISVITWLTGYGNTVIVKTLFDSKVVGDFTMAYTLTIPIFLLCNVLNQAWNPKFIELSKVIGFNRLKIANSAASAIQLLLATIASLIILFFSPLLFQSVGGNLNEYSKVVPVSGILMLGYLFLNLYYRVSTYYLVYNEMAIFRKKQFYSATLGLLLSVLSMLILGPNGIYLGILLINILQSFLFSSFAMKKWSIKIPYENLLLTGSLFLTAISLSYFVQEDNLHIVLVFLFIVVYSLIWIGINRKSLKVLKGVFNVQPI